jgi:hypothetical protein
MSDDFLDKLEQELTKETAIAATGNLVLIGKLVEQGYLVATTTGVQKLVEAQAAAGAAALRALGVDADNLIKADEAFHEFANSDELEDEIDAIREDTGI